MPHSDDTKAPPGPLRDALRELREAGGAKRWIHCQFSFSTVGELVAAGWVTVDEGLPVEGSVRLTRQGAAAIEDRYI